MYNKDQLCEKIRKIYPDIGECGINLNVAFDRNNNAWVVTLKKGHHKLKTFLEKEDATTCMDGKQCIGLGLQISQLKDNISYIGHC